MHHILIIIPLRRPCMKVLHVFCVTSGLASSLSKVHSRYRETFGIAVYTRCLVTLKLIPHFSNDKMSGLPTIDYLCCQSSWWELLQFSRKTSDSLVGPLEWTLACCLNSHLLIEKMKRLVHVQEGFKSVLSRDWTAAGKANSENPIS